MHQLFTIRHSHPTYLHMMSLASMRCFLWHFIVAVQAMAESAGLTDNS